jgi:hypothetical protein
MARYAVIGWGSLLWDLDDLAPRVEGVWARGKGPRLPLEFSRVSPKRRHSLVVVLDAAHGRPCPTHAIASRRRELDAAAEDLAARERAPVERIGAVCLASGETRSSAPGVAGAVAAWCAAGGWTGAVWTDLPANFAEVTGRPFSLAAGHAYLRELPAPSLAEAVRYIESAPAETDTPLRRRLAGCDWWRGAVSRHR